MDTIKLKVIDPITGKTVEKEYAAFEVTHYQAKGNSVELELTKKIEGGFSRKRFYISGGNITVNVLEENLEEVL